MTDEFDKLTPEELDSLTSKIVLPVIAAAKERQARAANVKDMDTTFGSSGGELALAGAGKVVDDAMMGAKGLGVGAFGTKEELAKYNREMEEKRRIDEMLMNNWQAKGGAVGANTVLAAATPARVGAQMGVAGMQGFLNPLQGDIKGPEVLTRLLQGGEAGFTTGLMSAPIAAVGKSTGGALKRYNEMGKETMPLAESARRLGVEPTMGSVDPLSMFHTIETGYAGTPKMTAKQLKNFEAAADRTVRTPSGVIGQPEVRQLHGDNIRQELVKAGEELKAKGSGLWKSVDDYIVNNNIPNVLTVDTQNTARSLNNLYGNGAARGRLANQNPVTNNALYYLREADDATGSGMTAFRRMATNRNVGSADFTSLHELQSVVGRAKELARQSAENSDQKAAAKQAVRELDNLYASISADVDRWGSSNPTAKKMVDEAKGFWRETVVPGTVNNDLFMKANRGTYGAKDDAYKEAHRFYSDLANKPTQLSQLHPYMSQQGQDMVNTFQLIPELQRVLKAPGNNLTANGVGGLRVASGMAARNPKDIVFGMLGHMPGFESLTTSPTVQRYMMGRNMLREEVPVGQGGLSQLRNMNLPGRAAWAGMELPQEKLEGTIRDLRIKR